MHIILTRRLSGAACLLAATMFYGPAASAAEPFPSRAITMVVPFPAGGTTDVIGRAIAQALGKQLGQSVVVDNKSGAAGTVGATQAMRAAPDGYTLLLGGPSDQVNAPFLMTKAPYDPARDFAPVGCMTRAPNVLVVNAKLPIQTVADLVKLAKAEPGKLNYGSAGNGNTSHLMGELFNQSAGINMAHVPYRGNAPAVTDTIGGQVQVLFTNLAPVVQHIKSGALRAIAVTSAARLPALPGVATLREAGFPIEVYSWSCLVVPARTPGEIIDKLNAALARSLDDPAVLQAVDAAGGEKFPTSREEAKRFLAAERATWGSLIRARKIHAD